MSTTFVDRPRPGANQTGAGSPITQQGAREGISMTHQTGSPRGWTYWVAFSHESGTSAVAVCLDGPLSTAGDVVALAARIEAEAGVRDVTVLSWQPLSTPDQPSSEAGHVDPAASMPVMPADTPSERAALVRGLYELAAVLAAHPEMPAPAQLSVAWYALNEDPGMSEATAVAAVDAAAAAVGVEVRDRLSAAGLYTVYRSFGPVTYSAGYISADARAEHRARTTSDTPAGGEL